MTDRIDRALQIARLAALAFLLFVAGAAAVQFEVPPGPFLADAFEGGAAWYERQTLAAEGRREPTYTFHPESQGRVRQGSLGDDFLLLSTVGGPGAWLIDSAGTVRHRWSLAFSEAWPDPPHVEDPVPDSKVSFQRVRMLPGGDLVVVYHGGDDTPYGYGAVQIDADSRPVWRHAGRSHHDFDIGPDGRIYLLEQHFSQEPAFGLDVRKNHMRDSIVVLSPDGTKERDVDLIRAFAGTEYQPLLLHRNPKAMRWGKQNEHRNPGPQRGDLTHSNSVRVLVEGPAYRLPQLHAGQVLVSIRESSVVAVLDLDTERIVWATRGPWRAQHEARFLPDGNLVLFDNAGAFPPGKVKLSLMRSRVIAWDVVAGGVLWSFSGDRGEPIYSPTRGTLHLLDGERMMVGASDAGIVQLATRDGRVLWEYQTFGRRNTVATAMLVTRQEADFLDAR